MFRVIIGIVGFVEEEVLRDFRMRKLFIDFCIF